MRICLSVAFLFTCLVTRATDRTKIWDPPAIQVWPDHAAASRDPALALAMVHAGKQLFRAKFNVIDGAGRPTATGDSKPTPRIAVRDRFTRLSGPDANSCVGCHNLPVTGGSGDFATNVFTGAHFKDPPITSMVADLTNERNTTSILGAGAVEMVAREMTYQLRRQRDEALAEAIKDGEPVEVKLSAKTVNFGTLIARPDGTYDQSRVEGVDNDLVVKPFGVKGIAVSLREFTIAALNQHHGIEAIERFGWERTGVRDFDDDGVDVEFTIGQTSALALFQASLPPLLRAISTDAANRSSVRRGEEVFRAVGCDSCHKPFLPMAARDFTEPNPYNRPGTLTPADGLGEIRIPLPANDSNSGIQKRADGSLAVWMYSDLRRHRMCDEEVARLCNEHLRQDNVPTDQFMTAKLWDLAESAPYGHRGDCDTVSEVILIHGGESAASRRAFLAVSDDDKRALISYLLTLGGRSSEINDNPKGE